MMAYQHEWMRWIPVALFAGGCAHALVGVFTANPARAVSCALLAAVWAALIEWDVRLGVWG